MMTMDHRRVLLASMCVAAYTGLVLVAQFVSGERDLAFLLFGAIPLWYAVETVNRKMALTVSIGFMAVVCLIALLTQTVEFLWALCLVRAFAEGVIRMGLLEPVPVSGGTPGSGSAGQH